MTAIVLDLTGLKCPLPALKARKALARLDVGTRLELRCTDPMAIIDIPVLIQQTGDRLESTARRDAEIIFVIEKMPVKDDRIGEA
ncbi:sulfurtransferase TusA family protein [Rhodopseudomonas palustris]|uniref:Sulfurtransferase TusA family protein n=1 Tax=Rhodopseudomonas palustris TaxID=1076 RepID=A0A418VGE7_RHOPL|nr:sulfurtransferase TusA family protein [Rhodopseudomonas palustris]RJF75190.1 sulfurtransferase TusA family protein [Rhodopseudomonas palustris]